MNSRKFIILGYLAVKNFAIFDGCRDSCDHGRRKGAGGISPWILKYLAKNVVFVVLSGKKQISPLLATIWKKFGKIP